MAMSMVPARNHPRESSRTTGLACGVIVLAALAVYYNSISCPFIFDDQPAITQNLTIRHFWSALSPPPNGGGVIGRPLVNFSLAVNYAVGGLKVWGYHATNLAIHILAGLTLFGIVRRTLLRPAFAGLRRASPSAPNSGESAQGPSFADSSTVLAFIVALLWTVHPLQTESVTSIIQRTESLMGLFYLLTLYCFVRGAESRSQASGVGHQVSEAKNQEKELKTQNQEAVLPLSSGLMPDASCLWYSASILSCAMGMATKEVMVSAPLIVLLYDRTFLAGTFREAWRRRGGWHLGLFGTWLLLGYLVACTGGKRGGGAGFGISVSNTPWAYALTQCRAIVLYLRLAIWPHPLVFDYGTGVVQHITAVAPQALILILLVAGTIFMLRCRPVLGFIGAWFFAILAPSSSVVPLVGQTMAEHRMYLPLAAVIALVVPGLYARIGPRSLIIFAAAAVGLGWLTIQRNKDYRSDLAIWSDTVAKFPGSARAHYNLGAALAGVPGHLPEAISEYEKALQIQPDYPGAHNNLGCILANIPGRLPEAIGHFEAALRLAPGYGMARNNLGIFLYKDGRISEAIAQFKEAVRIDPDDAGAHYNLGLALGKMGRMREAIFQLKEVVRINPDDAEAHSNLGIALDRAGQMPEALAQFEEAVRVGPDNAGAHKNLGIALGKVGRIPEAIAQCQEVLRINPDSADARAFLEKLQKAAK
jgi:tetratricopeptide (TPR) repeat protein